MSQSDGVAVCIVTHNSADDLPDCLTAIAALEPPVAELVVVDCASDDDSVDLVRRLAPPDIPLILDPSAENLGFAGGMNRAISLSSAPFILSLNPDTRPEPNFCNRLMTACEHPRHRVAAATGRLSRPTTDDSPPLLDACGMRLVSTWRHLDRGSGQVDHGQFALPERVFGATGAATLYRRQALDDAAIDGEVFLTEFHSYREDAELCFRLRERCWEIVYEPSAQAVHLRYNLPTNRRQMPASINYHSLKNRYLLRAYHQTAGNFLVTLIPTLWRDLLAIGHVLLRERTSLDAYRWLWRHRRRIRARRRRIQEHRTCPNRTITRWFFTQGLPR